MFLLCNLYLIFMKTELVDPKEKIDDISTVYKIMWNVSKMPQMRGLITVLLFAKIGFIANEAVTGLKAMEKGFAKEDLGNLEF